MKIEFSIKYTIFSLQILDQCTICFGATLEKDIRLITEKYHISLPKTEFTISDVEFTFCHVTRVDNLNDNYFKLIFS